MQINYSDNLPDILKKHQDKILNGKELGEKLLKTVVKDARQATTKPSLAVVLVGDDSSSHLYVRIKKEACEKCDIDFHRYYLDADTSEAEVLATIDWLNNDSEITGLIVQLPLPKKYDTGKILAAINRQKDVDALNPETRVSDAIASPLTQSIVALIGVANEKLQGKNIVILCNNKIFAEPFQKIWGTKNEVSVVNIKDKSRAQKVKNADILIVSLGLPHFITKEMIKENAIIIDVGINALPGSTKVVGDVDLADVIEKAAYISPVPGGVGPLTVAYLLKNLISLAE